MKFFFNHLFSKIKLDFIISSVCFFCFLPLVILSFFNQPSDDDFCYNTSSIGVGFLNTQINTFQNYNGRYLSTLILSNPNLISKNLFFYKILPILLMLLTFIALYLFISTLFKEQGKSIKLLFTSVILLVYTLLMPSICQGFYWMSSSITYQLSIVLLLFFLNSFIKLLILKKRKHLAFSILLLFLIIGTNEITMLLTDFIIGIVFVVTLATKKINYKLFFLVVIAFLLTLFIMQSTGNTTRGNSLQNTHLISYSLYKTLNTLKSYLLIWIPFILIANLLLINFLKKGVALKENIIFNVNPYLLFPIIIFIPFLGFFIGYWALGSLLPPRSINVIYFYFILSCFYFGIVLMVYFEKKDKPFFEYSKAVRYTLLLVFFIQTLQSSNLKTAYSDLFSSKAYNYDLQLKNRFNTIYSSKQDTVFVPFIKNKPLTLFNGDITLDNDDWRNGCYDRYFDKVIILKK